MNKDQASALILTALINNNHNTAVELTAQRIAIALDALGLLSYSDKQTPDNKPLEQQTQNQTEQQTPPWEDLPTPHNWADVRDRSLDRQNTAFSVAPAEHRKLAKAAYDANQKEGRQPDNRQEKAARSLDVLEDSS